jgi:hypothetical protein
MGGMIDRWTTEQTDTVVGFLEELAHAPVKMCGMDGQTQTGCQANGSPRVSVPQI